MGRFDWDQLLSVDPLSITDDEIEELCPTVMRCDVDEISDVHNLRHLMKLSQEMLQYKDNQVETLLLECSELKQTISSLKPEAAKRRKKETDIIDSQHDTDTTQRHSDVLESINYEDPMQSKKKKIEVLMHELESLEKDNIALKERLTILTEEMKDATEKMNDMTEQLSSFHIKTNEYKERVSYLERQNAALITQIEEIDAQQVDRDKAIDEFSAAIDARISEWKNILDEKDAEINRLRENLSHSLVQSFTTVKEENKSQIVFLNEEIERRDKIIEEFQEKLSQAVVEINESAALIEKLRADAQKSGRNGKRKEQRDLLRKLQEANEKISSLEKELSETQEDAKKKSSKLCEVLATLKKYEDHDEGLAEALREVKQLKIELAHKNEHITDLVSVVNKLEMLNSYQEMEIISLREKLGIPEDESISIQNVLVKRQEEARKVEDFVKQNKVLLEENIDLKSTIRMLKFKMSKSLKDSDLLTDSVDYSREFLHSTKLIETKVEPIHSGPSISELKADMQIVIQENEALRTGMHEILDSIRNQDGKSEVEIQSSTLERLLEALDVRHLAGWYHPAMRLQEHLNTVQGSNAELRNQIKHLRRELQKKDMILENLALKQNLDIDNISVEDSENDKLMTYISELKKLREAYENEADEWEKQKESLLVKNSECNTEIGKLKHQIDLYEENLKLFEGSDEEVEKALATKIKEYIETSSEIVTANRKIEFLQELLNKEIEKAYQHEKDSIKNEYNLRRSICNLEKRSNIFENEISVLQSNLSNSISIVTFNELKEKYEEVSLRFRDLLENKITFNPSKEIELLKEEIELIKQENSRAVENFLKTINVETERNLEIVLKEAKAKEFEERQRAENSTKLYEISQAQLMKAEENIKEIMATKLALQDEIVAVNKRLSNEVFPVTIAEEDQNKVQELRDQISALQLENENLKGLLKVAEEEAELQYSRNSLRTLELDSLRHQILDLQAASEDKAMISRLDFELGRKKISEIELNSQKSQLENEISQLREKLDKLRNSAEGLRNCLEDNRKQYENQRRNLLEMISFFQTQYAGSTPLSSLHRIHLTLKKIGVDRQSISAELKKAEECHENVKIQQDLLSNRMQIVESLKEILEQQIGSNDVHEIMHRFSEYSQYTLAEFKYKRRITQLEYDLQVANKKFSEYESIICDMEQEMLEIQKAWSKGREQKQAEVNVQCSGTSPIHIGKKSESSQTRIEQQSTEIQTVPYKCCVELKKTNLADAEIQATLGEFDVKTPRKLEDKSSETTEHEIDKNSENTEILRQQLNDALNIASERSAILIKYETQMNEYQSKLDALTKTIVLKDLQLSQAEKALKDSQTQPEQVAIDSSDKIALKSTINALQKLLAQKEETINRYQNLLKEDREEHNKTISRLQEETKSLNDRIVSIENQATKEQLEVDDTSNGPKQTIENNTENIIGLKTDVKSDVMREEEIARFNEQILNLEADLDITRELSERWHRLAEERLQHMDKMRQRLEEQHKSELETYRGEIEKWQLEVDTLRKQLSENRMLLTRGNISLIKELQERDDKIHQLSLTCQQLQNEVEMLESTNRSHVIASHNDCESKRLETPHTFAREQNQQTDALRKQLQGFMEKEKMYKQELTELKQQLSRRYMAAKTQEKKVSQREAELQKKVKTLEEEVQKLKSQLDQEFLIQEAKKAKTAEELDLWAKQKKWQQTAEKLKEKLKEKTDEYTKLLGNHEKLRSVVACMEREKWYLKSKLKVENNTVAGSLSARPTSNIQHSDIVELQRECQMLKERIKELTDRLIDGDNAELVLKIEEQKRRIAALEAVTGGNACVISQLEKLEMTKDILERMNLKLESENFELKLELEKAHSLTPRLQEKIDHLEKYIDILKIEKSSDSTPRSCREKDVYEHGLKKSTLEMEKTIFTLKGIIDRLQAENKRLKLQVTANSNKKCLHISHHGTLQPHCSEAEIMLQNQYEEAQKRIVSLETDLQLAEQRLTMFARAEKDEDPMEVNILKEQLLHKSELLDKVKNLLSKAAANEKSLRQRIQQLEAKQTLARIPETYVTPPTPE